MLVLNDTVTKEEILRALEADPDFLCQPAASQAVWREFLIHTPEILASILSRPLDIDVFFQVKALFFEQLISGDLPKKLLDSMPASSFMVISKSSALRQLTQKLKQALGMFKHVVKDPESFLRDYGVTEEHLIGGLGLRADLMSQYKARTLTVADLLRAQPYVLVKH